MITIQPYMLAALGAALFSATSLYDVLILPNQLIMTDEQVETVTNFVRNGGGRGSNRTSFDIFCDLYLGE